MTPQEKAKRYDKLAKEVKDFFEGKQKMYSDVTQTLGHLFPELKESEDEKARKAIISGMATIKKQGKETFATIHINDCIAWLEKQGEHKQDPYEQSIQYSTIEDGIKAHAETYSFNIESELFNQLTKEQQKLWRKEIEQAVISGGSAGVELARDIRYKENGYK